MPGKRALPADRAMRQTSPIRDRPPKRRGNRRPTRPPPAKTNPPRQFWIAPPWVARPQTPSSRECHNAPMVAPYTRGVNPILSRIGSPTSHRDSGRRATSARRRRAGCISPPEPAPAIDQRWTRSRPTYRIVETGSTLRFYIAWRAGETVPRFGSPFSLAQAFTPGDQIETVALASPLQRACLSASASPRWCHGPRRATTIGLKPSPKSPEGD